MDIGIIKDENKWLLEAINEQYEAIHRHGGKIPKIEFDILMENVRKFYETMHILQRLNEPVLHAEHNLNSRDSSKVAKHIVPDQRFNTKPQTQEPESTVTRQTSGVTVRYHEPDPVEENPIVHGEKIIEPVHTVPVMFKPAGPAPVRQESAHTVKKTAKPQEPDLFAANEPELSIKLKAARDKTFGQKIASERIENLKTAITINEKFMFINELFDGNLREYNETIETLNGFKNLDQAADYLDLMRKKNFWNTGSTAFKKLSELVERRF